MSLPDFLLEVSRVLIGLGLAVFIGVPLAVLVGRKKKKIFLEGEEKQREEQRNRLTHGEGAGARRASALGIFLEGEEGERERFAKAKFVAAGALLLGVLLEVQVMGSALAPRHAWRAAAIFLLLAALVSAVMVVLPRERYYREKSLTFEENLRPPWVSRADAARGRAARLDLFGFVLAVAALVLG